MVSVVAALPVFSVKMPEVVSVPVPVIVLLPLTPNVIPPLAVMLLAPNETLPAELVKLNVPVPRLRAPEVMEPVAPTVNELGVPDTVDIVRVLAP